MLNFTQSDLHYLTLPSPQAAKSQNGQLTIIAGSDLIHGAALLALQIATRIVDMVFLASPDEHLNQIAPYIKSHISSFIWIPMTEVESYISKSDAVLIGPGLKRFHSENNIPHEQVLDQVGLATRNLTHQLLQKFPNKQWIIDAGSLQTMQAQFIPPHAIITPNKKEYAMLFGKPAPIINNPQSHKEIDMAVQELESTAQQYNCHIIAKGSPTIIASPHVVTVVPFSRQVTLTKGATGDCLAALTAALTCKNSPHLSAASADFLLKNTALELENTVGPFFNSDDLAQHLPSTMHKLLQTYKV